MPCPEPNGCPTRANRHLRDFHGINRYTARKVYAPTTKAELVAAVVDAEAAGLKAKAYGSFMSLSAAAVSDDCAIDTSALDKQIGQPVGSGAATWPDQRFRQKGDVLAGILAAEVQARAPLLAFVEAGIAIKQLLADLKGVGDPGLALPTMGAGGMQSLAGALSTGTHGADIDRQPLVDAVRAIHLVGPGGQEWWLERSNGFSDTTKLTKQAINDWCADTHVVQDDRMFYSALVATGRMGVIYAMVLELEPEYWLREVGISVPFMSVRTELERSAQFGFDDPQGIVPAPQPGEPELRFLQVVVNPNDMTNCWLQQRWAHAMTEHEKEEGSPPMDMSWCSPAPVAALTAALAPAVLMPLLGPLFPVLAPAIGALIVRLATAQTIGEVALDALNVDRALLNPVMTAFLDQGLTGVKDAPSGTVLDRMDYSRPKECYQGNGGEFCFNARATDYLTFIDRIAAHAAAIKGVPAYASMRFMRHTDAYLGMQRFPVTVSVEIGCLQPWPRSDEFLAKVSADALALGGVPHWGQSSAVRNSRASYGTALDYFHYAVARTEEGQAATFSSAFSRSNDLDPPASLAALTATIGGAVSLKAVLQGAEAKFMLPPKSTTLGSVARAFVPSLRMRAADVATTSGRAAVMTPTQIRLRDVAARVL